MASFDGWLQLLLLIAALISALMLFGSAWVSHKPSEYVFGAALLSFAIARASEAFGLFYPFTSQIIEWADLIAIVASLSGLFLRIRMSKPRFSRYPLILVFLPTAVLIVYPLILNAEIIKTMLLITFMGGAVIVALMVAVIQHMVQHKQPMVLTGTIMLTASYISFIWFRVAEIQELFILQQILLSAGMLITARGIYILRTEHQQTLIG